MVEEKVRNGGALEIATPLLVEPQDERTDQKELSHPDEGTLPPDGGWGWFVVLGSFVAHLIIGGFMRSGGVIFLELDQKFHRSASDTAWAVSLHTGLRLLFGPLASFLCNKFSCRTVAIIGSFISSVAVFSSAFATNLTYLYFTNGLIPGIGQALMYTSSVAIVGLYFHKRRGTAVGIANAGVGAGTFLFPPLLEIMFNQFGFTGAFFILSGMFLNGCVCGALFRPLLVQDEMIVENREPRNRRPEYSENGSVILFHFSRDDLKALSYSSLCYDINILGSIKHLNRSSKLELPTIPGKRFGSNYDITVQNGRLRADSESRPKRPEADFLTTNGRIRSDSDMTPMQKKAFLNSLNAKSTVIQVKELTNGQKTEIKADEIVPEEENNKKKLLDLSPLKDIRFSTLCVGIGLLTLSFQSSFVFLPPLVLQKGMSEIQGAYLVSIAGAMETFGSVSSGFLVDLERVRPHRLAIYNIAMVLLGLLTIAMPFLEFFIISAFVCGVYGCVLGMCLAQKATFIVDITGVHNLVSSFGILVCFQGIGTLIGPPLAGCIKDITGRYQDGFLVGGAMLICAGIIQTVGLLLYNLASNKSIRQANNSSQQD